MGEVWLVRSGGDEVVGPRNPVVRTKSSVWPCAHAEMTSHLLFCMCETDESQRSDRQIRAGGASFRFPIPSV